MATIMKQIIVDWITVVTHSMGLIDYSSKQNIKRRDKYIKSSHNNFTNKAMNINTKIRMHQNETALNFLTI